MCTNFMIPVDESKQFVVTGRTMDFGSMMDCVLCMVPRGTNFPQFEPDGPYRWTTRFGFVGITVAIDFSKLNFDLPYYSDGLNEMGLSVGALWLPGTKYPEVSATKGNVFMADFCSLILGMAANVDEAAKLLETVNIIDFPILRDTEYPPLHFIICDEDGKSLVVEFIDGAMQTTAGVQGVLTNAPEYDWHVTNQANYESLSVFNCTKKQWGQETNGSGMFGLPGDATPPSRFTRISTMLQAEYQPTSTQEAVGLATQMLDLVTVPYGTIMHRNMLGQAKLADVTQWRVVRDHRERVYYMSTAFNPTLQVVDLARLDFSAPKRACIPMVQMPWFNDCTDQLPNR